MSRLRDSPPSQLPLCLSGLWVHSPPFASPRLGAGNQQLLCSPCSPPHPPPASPLPSSRKHAPTGRAGGLTLQALPRCTEGPALPRPAAQHLPSTAASCSLRRCSRARSAGLCMDSSAPPRVEPSRFTNCRTDGRGLLRGRGSPGAWAISLGLCRLAVARGARPGCSQSRDAWPQGRGSQPSHHVSKDTQHCLGALYNGGDSLCLHCPAWRPWGPRALEKEPDLYLDLTFTDSNLNHHVWTAVTKLDRAGPELTRVHLFLWEQPWGQAPHGPPGHRKQHQGGG